MHIIALADGQTACYHCCRPFETVETDVHPTLTEEVWIEASSYNMPGVGHVRFEGFKLRMAPGASRERMRNEIEGWVLRMIKQDIIKALGIVES